MTATVSVGVTLAVVTRSERAWACGKCIGEGGSSVIGWLVIGGGVVLGYWLLRKR